MGSRINGTKASKDLYYWLKDKDIELNVSTDSQSLYQDIPRIKIMKTYIIAEIGINHYNGDMATAKKLIDVAAAGCDAVKFQKRNPDVCVPEHQKSQKKRYSLGRNDILRIQISNGV